MPMSAIPGEDPMPFDKSFKFDHKTTHDSPYTMIKMGHNLSDFNITNATILTTSQARLQFWLLGQIAIHIVKNTFQVFYILLAIPKFITTIFFSIFDTKCVLFEHASVINCSQKFFTPNPRHWVVAWLGLSFTSSFTFLLIVWCNRHELNYQLDKAKKILRKGSFWSLFFYSSQQQASMLSELPPGKRK